MRVCVQLVFVVLVAILCGASRAEGIEILNPKIEAESDASYVLSSAAKIDFNPRLEDAVEKGIPLFFTLEFVLERPRWYWSDQSVAKASQTWRLSYHALTRQYRLTTGSLHQTFPDLASALRALARVHRWQIVDKPLEPGETLNASLRLRLDTTQLPKLFQVSASFTGSARSEWALDSGKYAWKYTVPAAFVTPQPAAEEDAALSDASFEEPAP
ncbi:MAG: DUF4390 domain-containing protein [Betaproteobacteria bacterium]|nr:DUF4390 domain-containing protein [Betaproteobacteria bacterium]